jgi:hypothetical protein
MLRNGDGSKNQNTREGSMVGALSLIGIVHGAAAAYFAGRFEAHREAIETGAGVLFIGGLVLLGSALPAVL